MNSAKLRISLWYSYQTTEVETREFSTSINYEHNAVFGVRQDHILKNYASSLGYAPTGNYRIVIDKQTPSEIANIYVDSIHVTNDGYDFRVHIGVSTIMEAMNKLGLTWKAFYARYNSWLKNATPNYRGEGIIGLIKGTFYGTFTKRVQIYKTNNLGTKDFNIDKDKKEQQLIWDFGPYNSYNTNIYFSVDREYSDKNIEVKLEGNKLFASYIDKEPPIITDVLPANNVLLLEDFQPKLSAKFNDVGGSSINVNSFSLIIDENSPLDKIIVDCKTLGLSINANGFSYTLGKKLDFGSHSMRIKISDFHGRSAEAVSYFQIIRFVPIIVNITPGNGLNITEPRPIISAQFIDNGKSGVDLATFLLTIDGSRQVKMGAQGLVLNETGFAYTPLVNLQTGKHKLDIIISDKSGHKSSVSTSFEVALKPFNTAIGDLPVIQLENLGATIANTYDTKANIKFIKDLLNCDPRELSTLTGVPLRTTIDNVKRAQIACTYVRFKRMNFGELFDKTVYDIGCMTDKEILDYDQSVDASGNPIVESSIDLADLRQNIDLLFICLDDNALMNLKFGQIIFNQPDGSY